MRTFIILSIVVFLGSSLHLGKQHQRQISKQCCASRGGFQCGKVETECCVVPKGTPIQKANSDLCTKGGLFGSAQYCPGEKITTECQYCHTVCENKNGIMCGLSSTGADQCCTREDCIPDINFNFNMKKCKPGSEIKLPVCVNDMNVPDQVIGKLQNIA